MLTNLLPGLRELRAPLAAGYLWLTTAWLAAARRLPNPEDADGIWEDIYRLGRAAGKPGVIAALTFAAYVIGMLTEQAARLLVWPMEFTLWKIRYWKHVKDQREFPTQSDGILREALIDALVHRYWHSEEFRAAVQALSAEFLMKHRPIREPMSGRMVALPSGFELRSHDENVRKNAQEKALRLLEENENVLRYCLTRIVNVLEYVDLLREDLRLVPARLVGKQPDIYARWDRLRAESDFRLSIAPPILALGLVLAMRLSPTGLLLILPCGYLLYQGLMKQEAADAQLAEALRVGRDLSPTLERVQSGELRWS